MGENFYVVADETDYRKPPQRRFRYVQFGKQIELFINHKHTLAALMLIENAVNSYRCNEIKFINGSEKFENEIERTFGHDWKDHVEDVSKEYEEYAIEELEPDTTWAIVRRLYEALAAEYKATHEKGIPENVLSLRISRYQLLKYLEDGK